MSGKWTKQQKTLYAMKLVGGAAVVLPAIAFIAKWGTDRTNSLFDEVNEEEMGIDDAIDILKMSNELGVDVAKGLLSNAVADTYDDEYDNVIPLRQEA